MKTFNLDLNSYKNMNEIDYALEHAHYNELGLLIIRCKMFFNANLCKHNCIECYPLKLIVKLRRKKT